MRKLTVKALDVLKAATRADWLVTDAPGLQKDVMSYFEVVSDGCDAIKKALDPIGILSPGRFGVG